MPVDTGAIPALVYQKFTDTWCRVKQSWLVAKSVGSLLLPSELVNKHIYL